ncbi:hypothetical protein [Bacillus sp. D386]|nr:hypothetical protein [Bacillus sp. D386]
MSSYDSSDPDTSLPEETNSAFYKRWGKIIVIPLKRVVASS